MLSARPDDRRRTTSPSRSARPSDDSAPASARMLRRRRSRLRRATPSFNAPSAERAPRFVERGAPQLVARRPIAERLTKLFAMALTDDDAQVRLVLERVAVLL